MADLFDSDVKTIGEHINNALEEELDDSAVAKFATVDDEGGKFRKYFSELRKSSFSNLPGRCLIGFGAD